MSNGLPGCHVGSLLPSTWPPVLQAVFLHVALAASRDGQLDTMAVSKRAEEIQGMLYTKNHQQHVLSVPLVKRALIPEQAGDSPHTSLMGGAIKSEQGVYGLGGRHLLIACLFAK